MFGQRLKTLLLKPIFKFRINYRLILNPFKWPWRKFKEFLKILLLSASVVAVFLIIFYIIEPTEEEPVGSIGDQVIEYIDEYFYTDSDFDQESDDCNVAGVVLRGELATYTPPEAEDETGRTIADQVSSEDIIYAIVKAEKDERIKAIFLEVDSYGGSPVAGEEVSNALKYAKKPTAVLIRGAGASAAYLAATGGQRIFASRHSDVGGIGVTMSYVDNAKQNEKNGLSYVSLSSGRFKDTGAPNKQLTAEEKKLLLRDVNIMHNNFVATVAANRKLAVKKVAGLADGSTMLGEMALQNGLIDQIGNEYDVRQYLTKQIGAEAVMCW